ncbi:ABC-type tungstate transport system ATP-binding protein [Vibrio maritimus]|uniref:ABC-type tungstate transport system ATP-binding protein n=2 Tax=Vibrio TaxID=662 RepID=A0A090T9J7_9VIBR|nr:ABC-type tungstate transport system ATP-binding protein [Vibrio maritimus]
MAQDLLEHGSSIVVTSHQTNALTRLCRKQWWIKDCTLIESPLLQIIDKKQKDKESIYVASNSD